MARELNGVAERVLQLEGGVTQLREKERYQRCQVTVGDRQAARQQRDINLDSLKQVLQEDSASIADLVRSINTMKKDLEM